MKKKRSFLAACANKQGGDDYFVLASMLPKSTQWCLLIDGMSVTTFPDDNYKIWYYRLDELLSWAEKEIKLSPCKPTQLVLDACRSCKEKIAVGKVEWS